MNSETVPHTGKKTICIDFDGVIIPFVSDLYADVKPLDGAKDVIQMLYDRGFRIVIMTSRMSQEWWYEEWKSGHANTNWQDFGERQEEYVRSILHKFEIPYHRITAEKVPALFYLDDRAIHFDGSWMVAMMRMLGTIDAIYPH